MTAQRSPFVTRPGMVPPYLLGRAEVTAQFNSNFDNPLTDEHGNMLLMGLRGVGKTVMLNEAGRLARENGWLVVNSYLTESGLISRLHNSLTGILRPHRRRITGGGLSFLGYGGNVTLAANSDTTGNLHDNQPRQPTAIPIFSN